MKENEYIKYFYILCMEMYERRYNFIKTKILIFIFSPNKNKYNNFIF